MSAPFLGSSSPAASPPQHHPTTVPLSACVIASCCSPAISSSHNSTPAPTFQPCCVAALRSSLSDGLHCHGVDPMRAHLLPVALLSLISLPGGAGPRLPAASLHAPCVLRSLVSGCFPFPEETGVFFFRHLLPPAAAVTPVMLSAISSRSSPPRAPSLEREVFSAHRSSYASLLFFPYPIDFWATVSSRERFTEFNFDFEFDSCTASAWH